MSATALLLIACLVALLLGLAIAILFMRPRMAAALAQVRSEAASELALVNQRLNDKAGDLARAEGELATQRAAAEGWRSKHELLSQDAAGLRERASSAEELQAATQSQADEIESLREAIGKSNGELSSLRAEKAQLTTDCTQLRTDLAEAQRKVTSLASQVEHLNGQMVDKEREFAEKLAFVDKAKQELTEQFKNLASEILEDKSKRFTEQNQKNLANLINPLQEKIGEFRAKVEQVYDTEGKERAALKSEVNKLFELNQTISQEAKNLTTALKGNSKTQGTFGEVILESVLERAGLRKGEQFHLQQSHTDEEGRRQQPDIVISLPEERSLVVDSKMSLTAYAEFSAAEDEEVRAAALKRHLVSIRGHIKGLSSKKYQKIYQLKTLDFVLMFVPVEPAYLLAVGQDATLFQDAWQDGVLLVGPSTLLFVLRTVDHLWRQEQQNRNAQDIARRGAELYDRLVGFIEVLEDVGTHLSRAQGSFDDAKKKLSVNKGNVVRQAQMLVELGVKPTKRLPKSFEPAPESDEDAEGSGQGLLTREDRNEG